GDVDITPYLATSNDLGGAAVGYLGDYSSLHVTTLVLRVGGTGRIQEGVNRAADGARLGSNRMVNVNAGTYSLNVAGFDGVTINKSLHVFGPNAGVAGDGLTG